MKSLLMELEQARARVAELEHKAEQERRELLAGLPAKYGFASFEEFADAVRVAAGLSPIYNVAEVSSELDASKAATPYWREATETETVATTFVAQGIQASRSAQASQPSSQESVSANEPASPRNVVDSISTAENISPQPAPEVAPTPAPRPLPSGTSLSDPSNFGLLPDTALLERGDKSEETFRMQLNTATVFAQQVMHTSRVPAAVWRAWRDFARRAGEVLRGSGAQVA